MLAVGFGKSIDFEISVAILDPALFLTLKSEFNKYKSTGIINDSLFPAYNDDPDRFANFTSVRF